MSSHRLKICISIKFQHPPYQSFSTAVFCLRQVSISQKWEEKNRKFSPHNILFGRRSSTSDQVVSHKSGERRTGNSAPRPFLLDGGFERHGDNSLVVNPCDLRLLFIFFLADFPESFSPSIFNNQERHAAWPEPTSSLFG